jgi:hypothetical protein
LVVGHDDKDVWRGEGACRSERELKCDRGHDKACRPHDCIRVRESGFSICGSQRRNRRVVGKASKDCGVRVWFFGRAVLSLVSSMI